MRLTPRSRTAHTLHLPDGIGTDQVMEVLRRYDPGAQRRRGRGRVTLAGHITVTVREGMLRLPPGHDVLSRALRHHLGGRWLIGPPEPGEHDEPLNDLLRVFIAGALLPAELATLLRPVLPGVVIRLDPRPGLFWFEDEYGFRVTQARDLFPSARSAVAATPPRRARCSRRP